MADKDTPIYDKTRMRGTTWVDATRILFNMGSELEEQVDGMDYEGVKQDLADEIINRQNADTQLGNRIDTLGTQVNQNKSDITQIKETINQMEDNATALGASVAELQTDVIEAQADIEGIKTSLVSDVITKGGVTTGTIVVEIEREDGTKITAEDFNYGKPTSMELLQGSSEGMMKAQFTLSDGTTIQSNDFQVLEMVTGDLYITSFTFKNGSSQGKISADIGLSDGRTLEANDFQLPTDPQVTQNIASLLSRMTAVEEKNSQQDTKLSSLDARVKAIEDTPGVGKFELGKLGTIMGSSDNGKISANPDGTGSVNGWDSVATVDELAEIQSDIQEQITSIKPTVTVNDAVNPPTISVAVNGHSSIANLPSSSGAFSVTDITNGNELIQAIINLNYGDYILLEHIILNNSDFKNVDGEILEIKLINSTDDSRVLAYSGLVSILPSGTSDNGHYYPYAGSYAISTGSLLINVTKFDLLGTAIRVNTSQITSIQNGKLYKFS